MSDEPFVLDMDDYLSYNLPGLAGHADFVDWLEEHFGPRSSVIRIELQGEGGALVTEHAKDETCWHLVR